MTTEQPEPTSPEQDWLEELHGRIPTEQIELKPLPLEYDTLQVAARINRDPDPGLKRVATFKTPLTDEEARQILAAHEKLHGTVQPYLPEELENEPQFKLHGTRTGRIYSERLGEDL